MCEIFGGMATYAQFGYSYPTASQLLVSSHQLNAPPTPTQPPHLNTTPGTTSSTTTTNHSSSSPGANSLGAGSLSPGGGGGALSPGGSSSQPGVSTPSAATVSGGSTQPCCESGRPLVTDPVTGQSVCSCQYDQTAARLSALQYHGRGVGVYGTPYPSTDQNPYPSIGVESSAFYSPLGNPYSLKDASGAGDMSAWTSAGLQPTTGYYPYDPTLAAYGYGAGYDLAARRKNATRESTATLKAWLNEHKKNPYPTKGEKIMLAIITKMTLTQVSTWFANARRRLKKENKMTWEPKNKTDDDDDALVSDSEDKDKDDDDKRDETDIHGRIKSERTAKDLDDDDMVGPVSGDPDDRKDDHMALMGGYHMHHHHSLSSGYSLKSELKSSECGVPLPPSKPKIWSLADTAACKTPPPPPPSAQYAQHHPQQHQQLLQHQHQQHHHWGSNGFALPSSRYSNGFNQHCHPSAGQGFNDVQADTPPQTPPSMKLPTSLQNGNCYGAGVVQATSAGSSGFLGGFGSRLQSPNAAQRAPTHVGLPTGGQMGTSATTGGVQSGQGESGSQQQQQQQQQQAAFKPFYKNPAASMNGGFVSPV